MLESRLTPAPAFSGPATTFSIADNSVIEPRPGSVNLDFPVTRVGDLTSQVTVGYTTVAVTATAKPPGADFTPETGTIFFPTGAATEIISIPIFGNGVYNNPDLTFSVKLTGIVNVVGPPVTMTAHSDFTAGSVPTSVAVADLNGDGKPDLVVGDYSSSSISVLLNTTTPGATTPTFATQATFATESKPRSVAVADLNGDGKPDLVVANANSKSVSVLLNTTTAGATAPTFATQATFATGTRPYSVAVADFNGDGKLDLVVANYGSGSVSVLLNTTTPGATAPTFATQATFVTGTLPHAVAVADLNGDGKPDIVVANNGANTVSVLLNTTTLGATMPAFATQATVAVGANPRSIALADLNGDGKFDIVVANVIDNTVSVLLNTTTPGAALPTFSAQATFPTDTNTGSVAVADLNGDGKPDLVVASIDFSRVSVLLNTTITGATAPSFAAKADFTAGLFANSAAIADFNGDGKPDVVVANNTGVSVLLNTTVIGAATIVPAFPIAATPAASSEPHAVAVGDLNGDGKPDLVVADYLADTVSVLLNTTAPGATTASFAAQATFATGSRPIFVAIADLNGDGKHDIVVANHDSNTVSVLLNTTTAGATTPSFAIKQDLTAGTSPRSLAIADVNGDGKLDLIIANAFSNNVSVLLNTTAPGATVPTFATQATFAAGTGAYSVAVGDLNGDGKPDIVVTNNYANTASVLLNTTAPGATTPTFAAHMDFTPGQVGSNPTSVALADINGDGKLDLVIANNNGKTVSVLLNTTAPGATAPSFATEQDFTAQATPRSVAVADLNGDGKPDIVVTNDNDRIGNNTVSVLLNTTPTGATTPTFAAEQLFRAGASLALPISVAIADLNGDGRPDIAVANSSPNKGIYSTAVLLSTPDAITRDTALGTITESDAPPAQPTVQFSNAGETVNEAAGAFSITATLSAVSAMDVTVPFTLSGNAVTVTDYSGLTVSPLVIKAGQTTGTITGTLVDDRAPDASKTLTFTLSTPTNATLGAQTANTVFIGEPPPPLTVQFAVATQAVNETDRTFTATVTLSAPTGTDVTVPFTFGGTAVSGTDYIVLTSSPVTIKAGQTSATITGTLIDDGAPDAIETLRLTLGNPTGANLGSQATDTLTIGDSPPPAPVITSLSQNAAVEGASSFMLTITGMNFDPNATVNFGAATGLVPISAASTQIVVTIPKSALAEEGNQAGNTITVSVVNPRNNSGRASFAISDPSVNAANGADLSVDAGVAFTQTVATFFDPAGREPNASDAGGVHYTASIDWGDGAPGNPEVTAGIVGGPNGDGQFTVTGTHTYANAGNFTVTTTIHHETAPDQTATDTVMVAPPPNQTATITSLNVGSPPFEFAPFTLVINGANFVQGATVGVGNTTFTPDSVTANQITVTVATTDEGAFAVSVVNPGQGPVSGGTAAVQEEFISGETRDVNHLFFSEALRDLMRHAPNLSDINFYTGWLNQGLTRIQVIHAIQFELVHHEFFNLQINDAYEQFFHRGADALAYASWVPFLMGGKGTPSHTLEQLEAMLIGSPEYRTDHPSDYLDAFFQDALGRSATDADRQQAQGGTPQQAATAVFAGDEFRQQLLNAYYQDYLDHGYTPSDANPLSESFPVGVGSEDEIANIIGELTAHEFFNKTAP